MQRNAMDDAEMKFLTSYVKVQDFAIVAAAAGHFAKSRLRSSSYYTVIVRRELQLQYDTYE
jgi:hypothetical protein